MKNMPISGLKIKESLFLVPKKKLFAFAVGTSL
jgi:hypothetical protein